MAASTKIHWTRQAAVANAARDLQLTAKTLADGSVNPNVAKLEAELADFTAKLERKNKLIAAAKAAGYKLAQYAGTCCVSGQAVKPACGFVKQDENNKWKTYSVDAVIDAIGFPV